MVFKSIGFCLLVVFWALPLSAKSWSSGDFSEKNYQIDSVLDKKAMLVRTTVLHEFVKQSSVARDLELGFTLPADSLLSKFQVEADGKWASAKRVTQDVKKYYYSGRAQRGAKTKFTAILYKMKDKNFYRIHVSPIDSKKSIRIRYQVNLPIRYKDGKYYHDLIRYTPKMKHSYKTDYEYRFLGKKKAANEPHVLTSDPCTQIGLPYGCRIVEIEVPRGQHAKNWFVRMDEDSGTQKLSFSVMIPEGKTVFSGFLKDKEKEIQFKKGIILPEGIWKVGLWTRAEKVSVKNLRIESEKQTFRAPRSLELFRTKGQPTMEIVNAFPENKSKLLYSQIRVGGQTYTKADFFAANPLSILPKNPLMIFLLDTSISQEKSGVVSQLRIIESIRENTTDEEAIIIAYNRNAGILFDAGKLEIDRIKLENGSNIDLAFKMAKDVVKKKAGKRPVFIYALSDFEFREGLNDASIAPLIKDIPQSAVIHTIKPYIKMRDRTFLRREDSRVLAKLAAQYNGLSARFNLGRQITAMDTLHFVRPMRLDSVEIDGLKNPRTITEGNAVESGRWKSLPKVVQVRAKLWAKNFRLEARTDAALNERTEGYILAHEKLTRRQILTLSKRTNTATRYNSFIIKGSAKRERWVDGVGSSGFHSRSHRQYHPRFGGSEFARRLLSPALFSDTAGWCIMAFAPKKDISVTVQIKGFEIVDVRTGKSGFEKCVEDGIWKTHLKKNGRYQGRKLYFRTDGTVSISERRTPVKGI